MAAVTHKLTTGEAYQLNHTVTSAIAITSLFDNSNSGIAVGPTGQVINAQIFTGAQYLSLTPGDWLVVYTDGRQPRVLTDQQFQSDWELDPPETPGA
jgi:hypothetical protein